jgi:hypothetical protein
MALITFSDITSRPLADAVKAYTNLGGTEEAILCEEATRAVETYVRRRLDSFTGLVENHRAQAVDPDAQSDIWVPLDLPASIGLSRAQSLGSTDLVRAVWLDEYPARYQDYWVNGGSPSSAINNITAITIYRDVGGSAQVVPTTIQEYEVETGFVRFALGTYVPIGSTVQVTYSGGYSNGSSATPPEDLKKAVIYEAVIMALTDLTPEQHGSGLSIEWLRHKQAELLSEYMRGDD